jgi:CRP-like cAMP-binding protein
MTIDPKTARLAEVPLFAGCDQKHLEEISHIADEAHLEAGRNIVTQGVRHHHAYVVTKGTGTFVIDGQEVGTFGKGELIGEISVFDPAPAAATATTTGPTDVMIIEHARFIETVRDNPDLAVTLLRNMARRIHELRHMTD